MNKLYNNKNGSGLLTSAASAQICAAARVFRVQMASCGSLGSVLDVSEKRNQPGFKLCLEGCKEKGAFNSHELSGNECHKSIVELL